MAGATYSVNIELNQEGLQKQLTDLKTNIQGLGKLTSKNAGASREELKTITAENNLLNSNATVLGRALRLKKSSVDISNQEVRSAEAIKLIQDGEFKQAKELISASRLENTLSKNKLIMEEKTAKVAGKQVDTEMEMLRAKHRNFAVRDRLEKLAKAGVNVDQARLKYGELNTAQGAKDFDHAKKLVSELSLQLKPMERKLRLQQKINAEAAKEANRIKRLKQMSSPIRGNALTDVGSPAWNDRVSRLRGDTSPVRGTASMRGSPAWLEARSSRNRMATQSALISGAFPLLFGQGPVTAAAGALGGGLGAKFGGQMGGFAGGLAATAAVSAIQEMITGIADLGRALDPVNGDLDTLISSMGRSNTARGAELKMIEAVYGKQVALAEATKDMVKIIGDDGVKALRDFSDTGVLFANSFADAWLKFQAGTAKTLESLADWSGLKGVLEQSEAEKNLAGTPLLAELEGVRSQRDDLTGRSGTGGELFKEYGSQETMFMGTLLTEQGRELDKILQSKEEELELQVLINSATKNMNSEVESLSGEYKKHVEKLKEQHKMERRILELRTEGLNPALAKEVALIESTSEKLLTKLDLKLTELEATLSTLEVGTKEHEVLLAQIKALEEKIKLQKQSEGIAIDNLTTRSDENDLLSINLDLHKQIETTIKDGIVDGIYEAIKGTKTLGEVASQVLDQIAKKIIESQVDKMFSSFGAGGGGGAAGAAAGATEQKSNWLSKIPLLGLFSGGRAAGGPVTGGSSYLVGEKGPELFVPGSSGNIVPNNAMGGMTINVDASGSSVEGDADRSRELGQLIGAAVQAEIGRQQRPGGMLY